MRGQYLVLEYAVHEKLAGLFMQFEDRLHKAILDPFQAHYPHVKEQKLHSGELRPAAGLQTWTAELHLQREVFPLRSHVEFEDFLDRQLNDPVSGLLKVLHPGKKNQLHSRIQIQLTPAATTHRLIGYRTLQRLPTVT